jgi:hypothetical protein
MVISSAETRYPNRVSCPVSCERVGQSKGFEGALFQVIRCIYLLTRLDKSRILYAQGLHALVLFQTVIRRVPTVRYNIRPIDVSTANDKPVSTACSRERRLCGSLGHLFLSFLRGLRCRPRNVIRECAKGPWHSMLSLRSA